MSGCLLLSKPTYSDFFYWSQLLKNPRFYLLNLRYSDKGHAYV